MKMAFVMRNRYSVTFWSVWGLILAAVLVACSKDDEGGVVVKDDQVTEIGVWPHPGTGRLIRVIDETANYDNVYYENDVRNRMIGVEHVSFDQMPENLKETLRLWGMSGLTKVFRFEHNNETYYHFLAWFYDYNYGLYDASGEHINMPLNDYQSFISDVTNLRCIMVLKPENVKNATGAPNHFVGVWQNDWEHAHRLADYSWDYLDTIVPLHPDLYFNITQVKQFGADGQGYLRTIRRDEGDPRVYTDRFRYEIDDYFDLSADYRDWHDYLYTCYFEGGDTIQYQAKMTNEFQVFDHNKLYGFSYPWYKKESDDLSLPNAFDAGSAYKTPRKMEGNPLVGKWTGYYYEDSRVPTHVLTWVFREEDTGYWLIDKMFQEAFAYRSRNEKEVDGTTYSQITCFGYDTGFLSEETDDHEVQRMAKFSLNGDEMTLSDMSYIDAVGRLQPVKFHRVR